MNTKIPLRHGDWSFVPFTKKIEGTKIEKKSKSFTFGEGEATNHFHTLHTKNIEDMEWFKCADGSWIVTLKKDAWATHPEHSEKVDLVVPAGTYSVRQAREKDWFSLSVRKILD